MRTRFALSFVVAFACSTLLAEPPVIVTQPNSLKGSTAEGDALRGEADLEMASGEGMYFRSLSAEHLQKAMHEALDNRKESVEDYYKLRDLNRVERKKAETYRPISLQSSERIATEVARMRLDAKQLDQVTGKIFWPKPLNSPVLEKFRKPIDQAFSRRSQSSENYNKLDHYQVQRMVNLIKEAVESIKDRLIPGERSALDEYLDQVAFESSFDRNGNRIEHESLAGPRLP